jgi:hypothetical protein
VLRAGAMCIGLLGRCPDERYSRDAGERRSCSHPVPLEWIGSLAALLETYSSRNASDWRVTSPREGDVTIPRLLVRATSAL